MFSVAQNETCQWRKLPKKESQNLTSREKRFWEEMADEDMSEKTSSEVDGVVGPEGARCWRAMVTGRKSEATGAADERSLSGL